MHIFFYNPTAQNTWLFFQNNHYMESRYIFVVDMNYVDESDVVVHCEAYIVMYRRENRFDHLLTCKKDGPEVRKNILRKIE